MNGKAIISVNLVLAVVLCAAVFAAGFQASASFQAEGTLATLNVNAYSDQGLTHNLNGQTINWSSIYTLGLGSYNYTCYIKNAGNAPVTLNLTTNSWLPINASTFMNLTWNQEGHVLNPADPALATNLTLNIFDGATQGTSFSFNIVIIGSQ